MVNLFVVDDSASRHLKVEKNVRNDREIGMGNVLTQNRVEEIFRDCLFQEGEDASNHVRAEGIQMVVGFHPARLDGHKAEIQAMLGELPDDFKESGGGGASFLIACMDRHGEQWTGLHQRMEQLFQLGLAIGKVKCLMSRALWPLLPGGMPYYLVTC